MTTMVQETTALLELPPSLRPAKVSVLICTRDRPDTIGQALESVAMCDHPNFDLHVMDQSTTEATRQIVESLAQQFADRCRDPLPPPRQGRAVACLQHGFAFVRRAGRRLHRRRRGRPA